jgi:hypothetical protein
MLPAAVNVMRSSAQPQQARHYAGGAQHIDANDRAR